MNILVTGGAGYVGSVVVEEVIRAGHGAVVVDNLQQGHRGAVLPGARYFKVGIGDCKALNRIFKEQKIDAVMHMAAETVVEFSMTDPGRYFQNNIVGGLNLLDTMLENNVGRFIFSSTASVYGEPQSDSIDENHPRNPVNSYGESKLMFEHILKWYGRAYGLKYISFRYFCAAGATALLGEDHRPETHLMPNVLKAALNGTKVSVFGDDYSTPDGTCVRDFVHVTDIARGHLQALDKIDECNGNAYNLGNSRGYSVLEVIRTAEKVTGRKIVYELAPRRLGDPAVLIAGSDRARDELGWRPKYSTLEDMLASAWAWMREHPNGYKD